MSSIAVYPGSFDPMTFGHLDIVARAAKLFSELHVLVVHNPEKTPFFSSAERVELILSSLTEAGRFGEPIDPKAKIVVETLDQGLLVEYCHKVHASALIKGVRSTADLDYELPMAHVNRDLAQVETLFLPADPQHGFVSSSLVKQVAALGGSVEKYVPTAVVRALAAQKANKG
jgi:pantetheine-phosphate adenylyltransferase